MISLRLTDGQTAVHFTASDAASLESGCANAWKTYRAIKAEQPGYWEAQQSLNALRQKLAPDLAGETRGERIQGWIDRGHSRESAESLWDGLVQNRKHQLQNARSLFAQQMPANRLHLHIIPEHSKKPFVPHCSHGVDITEDLQPVGIDTMQSPVERVWTYSLLWRRIEKTAEADLLFCGGELLDSIMRPPEKPAPSLRLVYSHSHGGQDDD